MLLKGVRGQKLNYNTIKGALNEDRPIKQVPSFVPYVYATSSFELLNVLWHLPKRRDQFRSLEKSIEAMDDGGFPPNSSTPSGIDIDFMDQLFDAGCWLQTAEQASTVSSAISFPPYNLTLAPHQETQQQEPERWESGSSSMSQAHRKPENALIPTQNQSLWGGSVLNSIWIAPKANSGPSSTVKERLTGAIRNFLSLTRDRSVLVQIWLPVRRGVKNYLTTIEQPYLYDPTSLSLANYRNISENYQFSADADSKEGLGLPGRVFLGKEPEWTPDVRFFRQDEYPRVNHAQICDVRGSIALPVFEKGSGSCLGVVEIVTTTQKITYRPELETVCKALEAVDLRSSEILSTSKEKGEFEPHSFELLEILRILRTVCDKHGLPLGQTWSPCNQMSKCKTWNAACYVRDQRVSDFHIACSEQQLFKGQGVVGKAFETNEPTYAIDVSAYSKAEYPLSHHAKMFGLRGAVAIHLQCLYGACRSHVLEFFLPLGSQDHGLSFHLKVTESMAMIVHGSNSFCFFSNQKIPQEPRVSSKDMFFSSNERTSRENDAHRLESSQSEKSNHTETSWISELVEVQRKGKEVAISFGKDPAKELKAESQEGTMFSEGVNINQNYKASLLEDLPGSSSPTVLRQHFAGSLKEAAKSIGVCPTTLKRVCRQHGINRWPSRKIKKVGHSLKKLQLVMDSVQGGQGSIQLSSFYSNFPQLNSSTTTEIADQSKQVNTLPESTIFNSGGSASGSQSTSSSQTSSSSHSFSTGAKEILVAPNACASGDTSTLQNPTVSLVGIKSEAELHMPDTKLPIVEHARVENLSLLQSDRNWAQKDRTICKVKATFGGEMIRLSLTTNMSLRDLQCEIAKRFRIDVNEMQLKYLDDDKEWVLLACDDDLEECIDIHRTSGQQTAKVSVHQVTSRLGSSLGSKAQS
ncbi:hypothetical protein V2J09_000396 [Rumex salicifolius]